MNPLSWRLGQAASPADIAREPGRLKAHDDARNTLERTVEHLRENKVDLAQTPLTLGALLQLDPEREAFVNQPQANALLTREYRKPFAVPSESEI